MIQFNELGPPKIRFVNEQRQKKRMTNTRRAVLTRVRNKLTGS